MNNISKILIPYNFKESALNALKYAIAFSKNTEETNITLLHISSTENQSNIKEMENQMAELVKTYSSEYAQIKVFYTIQAGEIVEEILKTKKALNSDLIIMGTKGSSGNSELRNTNTSKLIHQAECPVIVVPSTFNSFKLKNITLAIDKSKLEKPELLSILLVIARRFNAKIHVLTVYNEDDKDYLKERDNESILEYYFERYYSNSSATRSSNIAQSIIDYDEKQSIDMLAIIPRNHSRKGVPSEGKLTQYLTQRTDIPIITID